MTDLYDILWRAAEPSLYITKEQYLQGLTGWTLTPHHHDGHLVGIAVTKGSEFHFVTTGEKWTLSRADIRHYLEPILAEYGEVTTETPISLERQHRFNKILGFVETGRDEFCIRYALKRLPF